MARRRATEENGTALVEIDPETGEQIGNFENGQRGPAPGDTDATRKSADLYWRMLGEGDEGTGYMTVHYLTHGNGQSEMSVRRFPSDKHTLEEMIEIVRTEDAPRIHPNKPGDYRFRLYIKNTTGRFSMVGNKLVEILAAPVSAAPAQAMAVTAGAGSDPAMIALLRDVLAEQKRTQAEMLESVRNLANAREKSGPTLVEILTVAGPLVAPLIAAWLQRPKDDPMKALTTALTLTGTIKEMRDSNDGLPPPGDEKPWYADMLARTVNNLPVVLQALNQRTANGAASAPMQVPPMVDNGPTPPPTGDTSHPFYQQVSVLVQVQTQTDPDEVAQQLWTQMPPQNRDALVGFLRQPGYFRHLAAIHPGVLDEPGWWADLADGLLERADSGQTAEVITTAESEHGGQSNHVAAHS